MALQDAQVYAQFHEVKCRPYDNFVRDPLQCNVYYKCSHGLPIKMECIPTMCFNPLTTLCDWCHKIPECNKFLTTTVFPTTTTEKYDYDNEPNYPCPVHHDVSIFLNHPRDCSKFYYCKINKVYGDLGSCADGLWFSLTSQKCVKPWDQSCYLG